MSLCHTNLNKRGRARTCRSNGLRSSLVVYRGHLIGVCGAAQFLAGCAHLATGSHLSHCISTLVCYANSVTTIGRTLITIAAMRSVTHETALMVTVVAGQLETHPFTAAVLMHSRLPSKLSKKTFHLLY